MKLLGIYLAGVMIGVVIMGSLAYSNGAVRDCGIFYELHPRCAWHYTARILP